MPRGRLSSTAGRRNTHFSGSQFSSRLGLLCRRIGKRDFINGDRVGRYRTDGLNMDSDICRYRYDRNKKGKM
jgi:hypothetical protein